MPRQARLDAPGILHHVIVRGIEKHRIVDDKVDRDNFVRIWDRLLMRPKRLYTPGCIDDEPCPYSFTW
jgi:hypothetical protein